MGSFLDKPNEKQETHTVSGNGLVAGLAAMQGWRIDMEVRGKTNPTRAVGNIFHTVVTSGRR